MQRKIRMGMVGGGKNAFIGGVHRMAATLDNQIELVCGAFSSNLKVAEESGRELFLPPERVYGSYKEMFVREKALPQGERMDFVAVVTPNHLHYPVAKMALEAGFHVMCDKPMTFDLVEAKKLAALVKKTRLLFGLTYNYTGYPLVKEARLRIANGSLGRVRKVVVEYLQGWLSTKLESVGHKQAAWRTDPQQSGASGCMGDIGTHAENIIKYVTGLEIEEMCADLRSVVKGRRLEDDGSILLHLKGGAHGLLFASQIAAGEENGLKLRVYGEKGGLEWCHADPNILLIKWLDRPMEVIRPGTNISKLFPAARMNCRVPAGHPEGFVESFANLYRAFALSLRCRWRGENPSPDHFDIPSIEDGIRGMAFIETLLLSTRSRHKWVKMKR
jgi:predicted dehydrogenase